MVLAWQPVEGERLLDGVFDPGDELLVASVPLADPSCEIAAGLFDRAPVIEPVQFLQAIVIGLACQVVEGVAQEMHVYRGLAGAFVVKPQSDPIPSAYGDTVLFLTDLRLSSDGTLPPSTMADLMNGRVGDHVLVNGQKNPKLSVPTGSYQRFRLVNATNARFLRLSFGNAPMIVIGSDGGLLEAPVHGVKDVLLVPAERIDSSREPSTCVRSVTIAGGWDRGAAPTPA